MKKKVTPTIASTTAPATIDTTRILKVGHCPSLSGKSELTYHIGCNTEGEIQFCIYANSANGYFNQEWVSLDRIREVLKENSGITSFTLQSVFKGKSQNNGGFLLAALKQERLVTVSELNERQYQTTDAALFMEAMKALMESSVSLDPPKKPSRKQAVPPSTEPASPM